MLCRDLWFKPSAILDLAPVPDKIAEPIASGSVDGYFLAARCLTWFMINVVGISADCRGGSDEKGTGVME